MVELALRTNIPVREWDGCDDATLATALVVLAQWDQQARRRG